MPSVILKGHKEGYEFILKDVSSFNEIKKEIDEIKEKYNKEILDLRKEVNTIEGKLLIRTGLLIFTFISLIVLVIRLLPPKA